MSELGPSRYELKTWTRREWISTTTAALSATLLESQNSWAIEAHPGQRLRLPLDWDGSPLVINETELEIWPGQSTSGLAINGMFPGPTIRLKKGDVFSAQVQNQLDTEGAVLHWHGLLSPAEYDGHPNQAVAPGEAYDVAIPIIQDPSMCWYHAHTHELTGSQVYRGLAGLFLIEDPERDATLGLPTGDRDIPLVIRDWKSNDSFELNYEPSMFEHMWGYLGDVALVNGTPDAWHSVDQGIWRFRILNGCNARVLRLGFSDGRSFRIIGSDGGLIGSLESIQSLDLGPGQRAEILVSFEGLPLGASTTLRSLSFPIAAPGGGPAGPRQGDPLDLITFHVDFSGGSNVAPSTLPAPELNDPNESIRMRRFDLSRAFGEHTINGLTYEMSRTDFQVSSGEVEIWEFVNQTQDYHPMHSHAAFFNVVSRNGIPSTHPFVQGWHDTILVHPSQSVQVPISFGPHPGLFLVHCHNLEHERQMMQNFEVVPTEAPALDIRRENDAFLVSWPYPSDGWRLQVSEDLQTWEEIISQPAILGDRFEWREEGAYMNRFFRLAKV